MMHSRTPLRLLLALILSATVGAAGATPPEHVSARAVEAHTRFLADDLLEGRDTGTRGHEIAAAYVAAQFALIGLEPGAPDGTWLQQVPVRRRSLEAEGARLLLRTRSGDHVLRNGEDVALDASAHETHETLAAELVFVGWGIDAPSLGLDDYRGLDVRGKAVVLLEGAPDNLPGSLRAHYSWIQQKERMAAAHGAVAVLTLKSPAREKVSPWDRTRRLRPLPAVSLAPEPTGDDRAIRATVSVGPTAAECLFRDAGHDLVRIYAAADARPPRGFPLGASVHIERRSRHEDLKSPNVIGLLPGSDPNLADKPIVVIAHLDHVGVGPEVGGDAIYNGAVDNAGGVAVMIEAARALAQGPRPRRPILFIAATGEEKGLLGSEYFAAHAGADIDRIAAAISVDGLMAFHDFAAVVALGESHSTLGEISTRAAASVGAVHAPDPIPERGNLALSDQYPFLRRGVPVLFPNPARGLTRSGAPDTAAWDDYERRRYHQPSDDMDLPLRWDVAARWTAYITELVRGAADDPIGPAWYRDDPLADLFAPRRPRAGRPRSID